MHWIFKLVFGLVDFLFIFLPTSIGVIMFKHSYHYVTDFGAYPLWKALWGSSIVVGSVMLMALSLYLFVGLLTRKD